MRLLLVVPHITLFQPEGHLHRLGGVLSLLSEVQISALVPYGSELCYFEQEIPLESVYYFKEPTYFRKAVPFFLDYSADFKRELIRAISETKADIVFFDFPWGANALSRDLQTPSIYFSHGVEKYFSSNTLKHLGIHYPPLPTLFSKIIGSIEKRACQKAKHILTVSSKDRSDLIREYDLNEEKVSYLPQPVTIYRSDLSKKTIRQKYDLPQNKTLIVFHGSKSHLPNREATDWICKELAPRFEGDREKLQFVIAGNGQPEFRHSNVLSYGYVDDLKEFLFGCDIALMPLRTTFGAQMKLLDYFSCGLPVVTTTCGARGYTLVNERDALITGDNTEELAAGLQKIIQDMQLQKSLLEYGHVYLNKHADSQNIKERLTSLLSSVVSG